MSIKKDLIIGKLTMDKCIRSWGRPHHKFTFKKDKSKLGTNYLHPLTEPTMIFYDGLLLCITSAEHMHNKIGKLN